MIDTELPYLLRLPAMNDEQTAASATPRRGRLGSGEVPRLAIWKSEIQSLSALALTKL
jgi:hypothetical protein